jgi:hypothetical protein
VAKRNSGRRGRSRKRRPDAQHARKATGAAASVAGEAPRAPAPIAGKAPAMRVPPRQLGLFTDLKAAGERPPPPWHPLPLSELLILVGVIGVVVAWIRGVQGDPALLGAGIGAVVLGTIEVSLREHMSGFRPHTGILAVIPAIVFHSAVILLALAAGAHPPRWLNYALLPVDLALVAVCFKLLRARYANARRARTALVGR